MSPRWNSARPFIKYLLVALGLVCLYGLLGSIGVPWLVRSQFNQWSAQHAQFNANIQHISYNPFLARLTLNQIDVASADPNIGLHFRTEKLSINLAAWASLWGKRIVINDIQILQPKLEISGEASAVTGLFAKADEKNDQTPLAIQIDQLLLEQGAIQRKTAGTPLPATLQLDDIQLQLEHFTSDSADPAALILQAAVKQDAALSAQAKLNLETSVSYQSAAGLVFGAGVVRLNDIALTDTEQQASLLQAPLLEVRWKKLDLNQHQADIARIVAHHVQISGWLTAAGAFNYAGYAKSEQTDDHANPWRYRIEQLSLTDNELRLQDRSKPNGPTLALAPVSLSAQALNNSANAFQLKLDGLVNGQGHLEVNVTGADGAAQLAADIKVEQIELTPLNFYLQSIAKVDLIDGDLNLNGHLEYRADGKPQLQFNGAAVIDQLLVNRQNEDLELLKWKQLAFNGLRFGYPNAHLHIAEIVAEQPYARIAIEANKTLNWASLAINKTKPSPTGAALPVSIEVLRIRDGETDFADRTLEPDFAASIHSLDGTIKNLSSSPDAQATLLLEGKVDEYAPVRVQGLLNPLRTDAYTDIEMHFSNMDLTRLSPYSGKFAGYRIDKGKLTLDLRYRLENRNLEAENQMIMDHLTLGERVDSQQATSLPIALAIALLRDSDGKIDIHLPISGNLDDPHFSLRDLYAQAITGLITKLVTSPFTALGNLLEGDAEEYGRVAFSPGKALLSAYQKEKLLKLAMALQQRSALTLEIRGITVPEHDQSALAEVRLHNHVRHRWREELRSKGEILTRERKLAPIPEADYRRLLLVQYSESGLGSTSDHHQAWSELLEKFAASETDLRLLAQKRAARIREFLIKDGGISEQRVFLLDAQLEIKPGQALESLLLLNGSPN